MVFSKVINFNCAELEFNRYDKLAAQNLGKKKLHERAIADQKEAEALVDMAKKEIEDCVITAPFEGVISLNDISIGVSVNENTELFTIVDVDPIKIDFRHFNGNDHSHVQYVCGRLCSKIIKALSDVLAEERESVMGVAELFYKGEKDQRFPNV